MLGSDHGPWTRALWARFLHVAYTCVLQSTVQRQWSHEHLRSDPAWNWLYSVPQEDGQERPQPRQKTLRVGSFVFVCFLSLTTRENCELSSTNQYVWNITSLAGRQYDNNRLGLRKG